MYGLADHSRSGIHRNFTAFSARIGAGGTVRPSLGRELNVAGMGGDPVESKGAM